MAVEDAFKPKTVNPIDPVAKGEKGKKGYWEEKADESKAEREYYEEQERIRRVTQPESPAEPAFKFTGGVNLGTIDVQEQQRQAREDATRREQDKEAEVKQERDKREKAEKETREAQEETRKVTLETTIKELAGSFQQALRETNERIAAVKAGADPSSLTTQFEALVTLSDKIRSLSPGAGVDPAMQLEITKLNMDNARADREHQDRMRVEDRNWELEKSKMQIDREESQARVATEMRKAGMITGAPELFGRALAKGLVESKGTGGAVASTPKRSKHHIEAGPGEGGEAKCPECGQTIAIGPTAKMAVCPNPNCNIKIPIHRASEAVTQEGEE